MDGVADLIPMSEPCHRDEVCRRLSGRLHDRPHALERSSVEDIANAEHRGEHDRQERRKQQVMPTRPDEYRIGHEAVGFVGATISVPTIPAVNPMLYRPHVRLEEMRGRRREDESDQEAGRQGAFTGGALAKLAVKARFGYGLAASLANASASGTALLMLVFLTPLMGADFPGRAGDGSDLDCPALAGHRARRGFPPLASLSRHRRPDRRGDLRQGLGWTLADHHRRGARRCASALGGEPSAHSAANRPAARALSPSGVGSRNHSASAAQRLAGTITRAETRLQRTVSATGRPRPRPIAFSSHVGRSAADGPRPSWEQRKSGDDLPEAGRRVLLEAALREWP